VISAAFRFTNRPLFSKLAGRKGVAAAGPRGGRAGGGGGGGGGVRDVIAHLLAAEGRAHENMPLRSVTAKRTTLIFRGMASLELADLIRKPVH